MKLYTLVLAIVITVLNGCHSKPESGNTVGLGRATKARDGITELTGEDARRRIERLVGALPNGTSRFYWHHVGAFGDDTYHWALSSDTLATCWDLAGQVCGAKEHDFREWTGSEEAEAPPRPNAESAPNSAQSWSVESITQGSVHSWGERGVRSTCIVDREQKRLYVRTLDLVSVLGITAKK